MKLQKTLIALSLLVVAPGSFVTLPLLQAVEIPTDRAQKNKPATIKVLLEKEKDKILIEAKGPYLMYNPLTNILIGQGNSKKKQWITPTSSGLSWGDLIPGNFELRLVPKDAKSTLLVNGIEYKGCVEIYDIKGKLHVVNEVDVERYLKSTLTFQFPQELDEEVMDSVAIAARTAAYYITAKNPVTYWHVDAKEVGYQGHAITLQNLHVDNAINNTRHMIMTYNGQPFPATWTKNSAGKTADFATFYRAPIKAPEGVESPFATYEKEKSSWKFSIPKQELAKALGVVGVSQFDLYKDHKSDKVYAAKVSSGQQSQQITFTQLQTALTPSRLKSSDFTVEMRGNDVVFQGFGEGTGVGLCLFSASAMADKGEKAGKILNAFFPGTQLERKRSID